MTSTLPGERPSVREILDSELVLTKDQVHTVLIVWSHQTFREIINVYVEWDLPPSPKIQYVKLLNWLIWKDKQFRCQFYHTISKISKLNYFLCKFCNRNKIPGCSILVWPKRLYTIFFLEGGWAQKQLKFSKKRKLQSMAGCMLDCRR